MPTYITAVAAGPYHAVRAEHDGIPLGIYCRQSLAAYLDPDEIFEITRQGFDFYHREFGVRYPFPKYDQLFVPEFKAGAMENAGCVTFLEDYVFRSRVTDTAREMRASTILHEMAHMWFGDLVTMRWWDDLWLNESFATWAAAVSEAEATRWTGAWTTFAQVEKAWAYRQDQLPSTHPIAADIPDIAAVEVNFDGITYAKGAAVLKQLVAYVGRETFLAGVRAYFAAHAWGNATLADLLGAPGADLRPGPGVLVEGVAGDRRGEHAAAAVRDRAGRPVHLVQRAAGGGRGPPAAAAAPDRHRPVRPRPAAASPAPGGSRPTSPAAPPRSASSSAARCPDLVLVNDDDLTYAKIRLDEQSLRALIDGRGQFADALPAAICWAAAWDMARDGELAVRDYLALVLAGTGTITDVTVLQTVLRQVSVAVRRFADPGWRRRRDGPPRRGTARPAGGRRGRVGRAAGLRARVRQPRGQHRRPDPAGRAAGRLGDHRRAGHRHRPALAAAAPAGQPGRGGRDADRRGAGPRPDRRRASGTRPRPGPRSPRRRPRRRPGRQIISGELPNATFRSTLGGFHDLDQDELLEPFAGPFFDVLAGIWQEWGSDMAQYFAEVAYPSTVITPAAIEAADAYLQRTSPPAALARLLSEGRDDVARALRCRQRDAAAAR